MFKTRTKLFIREQGGMYELYKDLVDLFVNDGFNLREIDSDSLYLHHGTENGKIGIQIVQKSINEVVVFVGEELPFKRTNEFKIETITQINPSMLFEKIVSNLRLVKYPYKVKLDSNENIIDKANSLYRQGNYVDALKLYNEAQKNDEDNTKIILQQAGCYSKIGLNDKALELYRRAKRNDPQNSLVYLCLGQYYFELNETLNAMATFSKGAELGCETCKAIYSKFSNQMFGG